MAMMPSNLPMPPLPEMPEGYAERVPRQPEATELMSVGLDAFGREQRLAPEAATAWATMREVAAGEGVQLLLISGFRSIARQREIVERKLVRGIPWDEILRVSAYPGFSEHHTGRAVDIGSPECAHLTESFEATREYRWLVERAAAFGFTLSYPREGRSGVAYEPWHWLWCRAPEPSNRIP